MAISCLGTSAQSWAKDVTLQWNPNLESNVAGYKVYYKDNAAGSFTGTGAAQGSSPLDVRNTTIVTLNNLDVAKNYFFQVTAYDTAGNESEFSNLVESAAGSTVPVPAGSGKGDINGDGWITIADALTLLRAALNVSLQTPSLKSAGDVWPLDSAGKPIGDGTIDLNDARLILQRAVGLISW